MKWALLRSCKPDQEPHLLYSIFGLKVCVYNKRELDSNDCRRWLRNAFVAPVFWRREKMEESKWNKDRSVETDKQKKESKECPGKKKREIGRYWDGVIKNNEETLEIHEVDTHYRFV